MKSKLIKRAVPLAISIFNRQLSKNVELILPINFDEIKGNNLIYYKMIPITRAEAVDLADGEIIASLHVPTGRAANYDPYYETPVNNRSNEIYEQALFLDDLDKINLLLSEALPNDPSEKKHESSNPSLSNDDKPSCLDELDIEEREQLQFILTEEQRMDSSEEFNKSSNFESEKFNDQDESSDPGNVFENPINSDFSSHDSFCGSFDQVDNDP